MIMNYVLEGLSREGVGFKNGVVELSMLMFAGDGLLLAQNMGDLRKMIKRLYEVTEELGMRINRDKSNVMIFINNGNKPRHVEGMKVVDRIKYLGIDVVNLRDCFKEYRKEKIMMSHRMSNLAYSVVHRSCDKVCIGRTY